MKVNETTEQYFFENILNQEGKILVDCYASWCGPCRQLSPIIDELSEETDDCLFYKIDVDNAEELCKTYGIMSIPTILIFENKELKDKLIGLKSKEEIKKIINK